MSSVAQPKKNRVCFYWNTYNEKIIVKISAKNGREKERSRFIRTKKTACSENWKNNLLWLRKKKHNKRQFVPQLKNARELSFYQGNILNNPSRTQHLYLSFIKNRNLPFFCLLDAFTHCEKHESNSVVRRGGEKGGLVIVFIYFVSKCMWKTCPVLNVIAWPYFIWSTRNTKMYSIWRNSDKKKLREFSYMM